MPSQKGQGGGRGEDKAEAKRRKSEAVVTDSVEQTGQHWVHRIQPPEPKPHLVTAVLNAGAEHPIVHVKVKHIAGQPSQAANKHDGLLQKDVRLIGHEVCSCNMQAVSKASIHRWTQGARQESGFSLLRRAGRQVKLVTGHGQSCARPHQSSLGACSDGASCGRTCMPRALRGHIDAPYRTTRPKIQQKPPSRPRN